MNVEELERLVRKGYTVAVWHDDDDGFVVMLDHPDGPVDEVEAQAGDSLAEALEELNAAALDADYNF